MADEYIRKSDAVMQLSHNKRRGDDEWELAVASDMEIIRTLPSADVVQVVRCRKCKYFWTYRCMDSMPIETCELAQTFYNPDLDFCSLAKRREE